MSWFKSTYPGSKVVYEMVTSRDFKGHLKEEGIAPNQVISIDDALTCVRSRLASKKRLRRRPLG